MYVIIKYEARLTEEAKCRKSTNYILIQIIALPRYYYFQKFLTIQIDFRGRDIYNSGK